MLALAAPASRRRSADITDADVGAAAGARRRPAGHRAADVRLRRHLRGVLSRHRPAPRRADRRRPVSQDGRRLRPGGNTALGSHDVPGVFGSTSAPPDPDRLALPGHRRAADHRALLPGDRRRVVAYDDVLDIGWGVWGASGTSTSTDLTASFTNPALDPDDPLYRVWGHPRDVEGETVRGDGVARRSRPSDVDSGTAVEMRVTMPRDPQRRLPGAPGTRRATACRRSSPSSRSLDEDFNSPWNRFKRFIANHALLLALAIAALAALVMALLILLARERPTASRSTCRSRPTTPARRSPTASPTRAPTAPTRCSRPCSTSSTAAITTPARRRPTRRSSTWRSSRRPTGPLARSPRTSKRCSTFFDQLLGGEQVAISEMKDKVPEHSEVWRGRWERMTEKLDDADSGALAWDRDLRWTKLDRRPGGGRAVRGRGPLRPLGQRGVVRPRGRGRRDPDRDPRGARRSAAAPRPRAPRARSPLAVVRALDGGLPAAVRRPAGDAGAVEANPRLRGRIRHRRADDHSGRIPEPVVASASDGTSGWYAYAFAGSFVGSSFDGSSFGSSFASQVAPQSSSSGGGGGFSGGGGGFSGGGGGGSW